MRWLSIVVKSFGIGIIAMLCGVGLFDLAFDVYFHIRFHTEMNAGIFKDFGTNLIITLRGWGFSNVGLLLLFLGGPALLFIFGFLWGIKRYRHGSSALQ